MSRRRAWLTSGLVLALVAGAAAVGWRYDLDRRLRETGWFGEQAAPPPAAVPPPQGLELAPAPTAAPVAAPVAAGTTTRLDPARVAAAVAPYVGGRRLGPHYAVEVADLRTGRSAYRSGAPTVTPASITKVLTGAAALESLEPMTRLRTTVRWVPERQELVLVGGGDPLLASSPPAAGDAYPPRADLVTLARSTAAALARMGRVRPVRLAFDDSLFTGPRVNPAWPGSYVPEGVVPPITALWDDQGQDEDGYGFVADPAARAADRFAAALRRAGVRVRPQVARATAPAGARELAAVQSAPVGEIVAHLLSVSDNQAAEVLAHQVGLKEGTGGSFAGGAAGVRRTLARLGLPLTAAQLYDGSGLSRRNLVAPSDVLGVLRVAAERPRLGQVLSGLPVAGFSGSLAARFDEEPAVARGRIRAKTGTLTGVHGLAGVAQDASGQPMAFVVIGDRVPASRTLAVRRQVDRLAAALGACSCHVGSGHD